MDKMTVVLLVLPAIYTCLPLLVIIYQDEKHKKDALNSNNPFEHECFEDDNWFLI